jgi:YD repeat-containing protein
MSSSSSSSSPVPFIPLIPVPWPSYSFLPPEDGDCGCQPCQSGEGGSASSSGAGGGESLPQPDDVVSGSGGVRLYDGKIVLASPVALTSRGFNLPFGTQLDYNSTGLGANIGFGKNWVSTGALGGLEIGSGNVLYKQGANSVKYFYPTSGGDYATTYFVRDRLFKNNNATPSLVTYTLTAPDGTVQIFNYIGKLTSFSDPYGNVATVTYDGNGNLQSVAMTAGSGSFQYDYTWSSPTGGNVTYVIYSVNGYAARRAGYVYASGLLKSIELRDNTAGTGVSPVWSTGTVEKCVFTYDSSDLLLHVIPPVVYRQMVNNSITDPAALNPAVPADLAILNAYAETEYAYNGSGLVSTMYTERCPGLIVKY